MITLLYTLTDQPLATRLQTDLQAAGQTVTDQVQPLPRKSAPNTPRPVTVLLVSPAAQADRALETRLLQAVDSGQHVIPIMVSAAPLPKYVPNVQPLDFTGGSYPLEALLAQITALADPHAPDPLVVLTPKRRQDNRGLALVILLPVLVMFVAGALLVGTGTVAYPQVEYDIQETARVQQRNAIIIPTLELFLPRTTADALNFAVTVQGAPTRLQPFLEQTATSYIAGSATPEPTWTPEPE